MQKSYRITAPYLTDEERRQATLAPGGLSGQVVDTEPLLGKWTPKDRVFKLDPIFAALQSNRHIYAGTVPHEVIAERRRRNKQARKSRRINRLAAKR